MHIQDDRYCMRKIAVIETDFPTKFGIPRQSGLEEGLRSRIVFEKEFRDPEALRGLSGFSHIWLIWLFSETARKNWSSTVRPPRLGGNTRMGVFATRSPFRPNPVGLSCVRLEAVESDPAAGPVLIVSGADLMDGTPILDIKPYLPFADCRPEASGGFAEPLREKELQVDIPPELLERLPEEKREPLRRILAQDPRPSYQRDPARIYGFPFAGFEIRFTVSGERLSVCEVCEISRTENDPSRE